MKEKKPTPEVILKWRETGISIAKSPKRKGYGRELIERALPYQLNAHARFQPGRSALRIVGRLRRSPRMADAGISRARRFLIVEDEYLIAADLATSLEARGSRSSDRLPR